MSSQVKRLIKYFNKINELNKMVDDGTIDHKVAARKEKKRLTIKKVGRSLPSAQGAWNPNGKQPVNY